MSPLDACTRYSVSVFYIFFLYLLNLSGYNFLAALSDRLLDSDEKFRKEVVNVICDVACHTLNAVPHETVKLVAERLCDKSVCIPLKSKLPIA